MEYKSKLKQIRESKGMTQTELALKADVNLRMVQNYEQGYKNINKGNVLTVLRLSEALGCDIHDILNPICGD